MTRNKSIPLLPDLSDRKVVGRHLERLDTDRRFAPRLPCPCVGRCCGSGGCVRAWFAKRGGRRAVGKARYRRNARTLASHNPRIYKDRIVGDFAVNGTIPPPQWRIGLPETLAAQ